MTEADHLCDRLVIIDHGRRVTLDTPEQLKADLGRDIVTLRTTPVIEQPEEFFGGLGIQAISRQEPDLLRLEVEGADTIVGDLVSRITAGHRLESVRIARPTLDDVFLHHTGRALRE
jgi:ABC-2 type transport system ATP-binding protein